METAYAQALWEMIQKGMKPKEAVHAVRESLVRQGREDLLPRIGRVFSRLAQREEGKRRVNVTIAREADKHRALREAKAVLDELGIRPDEVAVGIDQSQVGGWRLEGRETLVDASFKKYLLDMYNRATTGI